MGYENGPFGNAHDQVPGQGPMKAGDDFSQVIV